jgi:hypothetical protein
MDEMYRTLGREHEADLEREAQKRRLAAQAGPRPKPEEAARPSRRRWRLSFLPKPKEA